MLGDSRNADRHEVNEGRRTYIFGEGEELTFEDVESIAVSASGNHYLNLKSGKKVIVADLWLAIIIEGAWVA